MQGGAVGVNRFQLEYQSHSCGTEAVGPQWLQRGSTIPVQKSAPAWTIVHLVPASHVDRMRGG